MRKKMILKTVLLAGLMTTANASENCYADGIYVGVEGKFLSFGGDSMRFETMRGGKSVSKQTYQDISASGVGFKIGYQHYVGNRIEVYFNNNDFDTEGGDITTQTYGLNYEFGFAAISSGSKLLPYLQLGAGAGEASSDKLKKIDGSDVIELKMGLGFHYQLQENIYTTFGYTHDVSIFTDVKGAQAENFEFSDTSTNTLKVGVSYQF